MCWRSASHTLPAPQLPCLYNSSSPRMTSPHLLSAKSLPSISPWVTSSFLLSILTSATTYFLPLYFVSKCSRTLRVSQLPTMPPPPPPNPFVNLSHTLYWAWNHSGVMANSRGKCRGFTKRLTCSQNRPRRAPGQQACFICNNGFLLTKYLLAAAADVCVCVWGKFIYVRHERP